MNKVRGLDAIRFVCAFWVMVGHYGVPVPFGSDGGTLVTRLIDSFLHCVFFGFPAVVIFFVISGFCIHYPFHTGATPSWPEYFFRRYIRIGVPLLVVKIFERYAGPSQSDLENAVLWSLYAEIIYYTIYPLLKYARFKFGWTPILAVSVAVSAILIVTHPKLWALVFFGPYLAWAVGLPCWILGCVLAEDIEKPMEVSAPNIYQWRFGIWSASALCGALSTHSPISFSATCTPFGILVYFWLKREIAYNREMAPWPFLESAGKWSYSLYLMHHPAQFFLKLTHIDVHQRVLQWLVQIVFALLVAYLFHLAVERPSHWLARQAKLFRKRPKAASVAVESSSPSS